MTERGFGSRIRFSIDAMAPRASPLWISVIPSYAARVRQAKAYDVALIDTRCGS
jgi:hypothetical protein